MIYIGSHMSSAKGYEAMGKQARKLGADTFAFFSQDFFRKRSRRYVPAFTLDEKCMLGYTRITAA